MSSVNLLNLRVLSLLRWVRWSSLYSPAQIMSPSIPIQGTVKCLSVELVKLENKCEDLESRSRRNNIKIVCIPVDASLSTTTVVATLLKEAFKLEMEPRLGRGHHILQPKPKFGEHTRVGIARLHYYSDCADILVYYIQPVYESHTTARKRSSRHRTRPRRLSTLLKQMLTEMGGYLVIIEISGYRLKTTLVSWQSYNISKITIHTDIMGQCIWANMRHYVRFQVD